MANWEQELSKTLEKEKELLSSLENYSQQKTGVLVKGDVEALGRIIGKEQPLALQFKATEEKRLEIMKKYSLEGVTLSEAAAKADKEYRNELLAKLSTLSDITQKLKKRNSLNSELTQSRLEFYSRLRAVIDKPMYGKNGMASNGAGERKGLIDRKV